MSQITGEVFLAGICIYVCMAVTTQPETTIEYIRTIKIIFLKFKWYKC